MLLLPSSCSRQAVVVALLLLLLKEACSMSGCLQSQVVFQQLIEEIIRLQDGRQQSMRQ
jgi:hypothetical protein